MLRPAAIVSVGIDFVPPQSLWNHGCCDSNDPNADKVTGTICGVKIQEIEHPLMRKIRYMDKLVDELATGRPMAKILRT